MKILILLKKWPGGVGGGVKNIKKELEFCSHQIDIISREEDLQGYSFLKSFRKVRKLLRQKMHENNYDIIYTQDWSLASPLLFPSKIYFEKHFCMFHGNQFGPGRFMQNLVGKIMGKHLLCMAPSIKKRFPKANINYCGVNFDQFKNLNKQRKYLGWIQKGTEMLALEEVEEISRKSKLPLLIAKGFKHEEMNDKFYSRCKVFISFPPSAAGFQASWLEAMAAGVPIVLGNENGAGEIQAFDKVKNVHNIAEIVKKIKNPKKIGYKKWIKENDFTWKRHARELIKIFSRK